MTPALHPSAAELYELAADMVGEAAAAARRGAASASDDATSAEVLAHVAQCAECAYALRFVRQLQTVAEALPGPASEAVLTRVLATRATAATTPLASGRSERATAPRLAVHGGRRSGRGSVARWITATAAALALAAVVTARSTDLSAVEAESTLSVAPLRPRAGDTLTVRYVPAAHLFPRAERLVLRARLRTARDESYDWSLPVRAIATLRRGPDGAYVGRAVLPPDVVYAALAVEDSAAARVDDRTGRPWEVLRFDGDTSPAFDALHQRAEEMMGRSWEEGHATARRLVAAYPERVDAWSSLAFFERQLRGGGDTPTSAEAAAEARLERLLATARARGTLTPSELAAITYRVTWAMRERKTAADSATRAYWLERLAREAPGHWQLAQQVAMDLSDHVARDPRLVLDSLERVHARATAAGSPGARGYVLQIAYIAADSAHDPEAALRWRARAWVGKPDSALRVATSLLRRPAFREAAIQTVRAGLADSSRLAQARPRGLDETATVYARSLADYRRSLLAALGRALLAHGDTTAARETLARAADGWWNPALMAELARMHVAARDVAAAARLGARLAVDPSTPPMTRDSLAAAGRRVLGPAGWSDAETTARREMVARTLERATVEPVRGMPRLRDEAGRVQTLASLTGDRPAVVIFWSRQCGYALEAAPALQRAAERLRATGTPVVVVLDEPLGDAVRAAARKAGLTLPLLEDVDGTTERGLSNFGTPSSHVLDALGRIRFRSSDPSDLARQVAALQGDE